jgi:hypothetical protein
MTRSGGRDVSQIIEIRSFLDKEAITIFLSLLECLSPSLQLIQEFPLLHLEEKDQILKINNTDVRQFTPEQVHAILKGLNYNGKELVPPTDEELLPSAEGDVPPPVKDELLFLTYIKGADLRPEKHLSKNEVST